ncbi:hypothetical protein MCQ_00530 [Candidatus Bartonella washoeensis Sb944nv]|uniref:Uncharacterized protein n=1 Tax=Candidatus Bartonella washoeensis Sb944nv TaxID=1094563 RepID=J1J6Y8_9HYPH|nr:hypothetical protein MCQ_00530 [Bartonella washoeensis Sb944nv]
MLRCLWLLKGLVFGGSAGVFLLCTRVGAEHMGLVGFGSQKRGCFTLFLDLPFLLFMRECGVFVFYGIGF